MMAQALWTALGGAAATPEVLAPLASEGTLRRAVTWGHAIRLGQRLSAGVAEPLTGEDVAEVCAFAVELPHHVNIDTLTLKPVAQAPSAAPRAVASAEAASKVLSMLICVIPWALPPT